MKSRMWALNLISAGLLGSLMAGGAQAAPTFNPNELLVCPNVIGAIKNQCQTPDAPVISLDFGSDVTVSYVFSCPQILGYSPFGLSESKQGGSLKVLARAETSATIYNVRNVYFTIQDPIAFQKTGFSNSCTLKITGIKIVPSDAQIAQWQTEGGFHIQALKDGIDLLDMAMAYESTLTVTKNDLNSYINLYWSQFTGNFDSFAIEDEIMQGHSIEDFLVSDKKRVKTALEMQQEGIYEIWLNITAKYAILDDFFGIVNSMKAKVDALTNIFKPYKMTDQEAATWQRLNGSLVQYELDGLAKRKAAAQAFIDLLKSQEDKVKERYQDIMNQIETLISSDTQSL